MEENKKIIITEENMKKAITFVEQIFPNKMEENKKLINFIIDYLKSNKITYTVDGELITLHTGSYEGVIQLEGESGFEEDDYNTMQVWITNDGNFSNDLYHETSSYALDNAECEEMLGQLLDKCREVNKGVAKISNLIDKVKDVLEEYNIPAQYFLSLADEEFEGL